MDASAKPRLLGARVARVEDARLLSGSAQYVDDIRRPGTLHAAFLRSTWPHAALQKVDGSAAAGRPGVHAVLTAADLSSVRPISCNSTLPTAQPSVYPVLATDKVRFVGEAIAVVVADDRYLAEDALVDILVDVDELAFAGGPEAEPIHEGWEGNWFVRREIVAGEPAAALGASYGSIDLSLSWHRQAGNPLECRCCLAEYDRDGLLTLWTSTQIPHLIHTGLADCLGLPEHRIRIISPDVGGGFGIKASLYPEEVVVAFLAMRLRKPVKWLEDRREHLVASVHSREHRHQLTVGYRSDGVVTALAAEVAVDCGAYGMYPWTATLEASQVASILPGPYQIRDYRCTSVGYASNRTPLGPYRGVSLPMACFSIERAMDRVARAVGLDPVEVRLRNFVRSDQFPYTNATGLVYDSGSYVESLQRACEVADYKTLRRRQAEMRSAGRYLGIGLACYTEQTAHTTSVFVQRGIPIILGYEAAEVRMNPSGKVVVQVSTHSQGQGHATTFAQLVADTLTLPLADVRVAYGDTQSSPYGMGTFASRSAVLAGGAAKKAALQLRERLIQIAAHNLEAAADDLVLSDGTVSVAGAPSRRLTVEQIARWTYHRPERLPSGVEPRLEFASVYDADPGTGAFSNACHLAVVEVDPDTGRVALDRYLVVEDCGRMINPLIVDGQVHGGVAQGIGDALLGEFVYDAGGQPVTTTLMDYLLPGATDIPLIEVEHLETPSPFTMDGVKGMGEGGTIGPAAALAGAVEDALLAFGDVVVNEIPLTSARVRRYADIARGRTRKGERNA